MGEQRALSWCAVMSEAPISYMYTQLAASVAFHFKWASISSQQPAADLSMASRLQIPMQVLDLLEDACTGLLQHIQEHDLHDCAAQVA